MTVPVPEVPLDPWLPTLAQIGAYVPAYTVEVGPGNDVYTGTFSVNTTPTQAQVESMRGDALQWLLASTGALVEASNDAAKTVVAIRTAGMIALTTTPTQDGASATALLAQADAMLAALVSTNDAAGGASPEGSSGVPVWNIEPFDERAYRYFNGRNLSDVRRY